MSLSWLLSRLGLGRISSGGSWISNFVGGFAIEGVAVTATAAQLNSAAGEGTDIDAGASGTAGSVDIFPTTAAKGKLRLVATDNTNDDAVTVTNEAHGQATSVKIPDAGLATTYLVQSTAAITAAEANVLDGATVGAIVASKAVIADANKLVPLADAQEIDMAGVQVVLTAVAGAPAGTLLTSNLIRVDPNGASVDMLLPPEADCVGDFLVFHNVSATYNVLLKDDSDSSVIAIIAPDDKAFLDCNGTTWQGGTMKQNMTGVYRMNPWDMRCTGGLALTETEVAGGFYIGVGGAASGLSLLGEISQGTVGADTETSVMRGRFNVPMNYIAGQSFVVSLESGLLGSGAVTASPTIDLVAKLIDVNGTLGADICATAAQNLVAGAPSPANFTITPTTITPGSVLELEITTVVDNTNTVDIQSEVSGITIQCTVNN